MEWISKLVTPRGSEGDGEAAPAPATDDDRLSPTPHIRGGVTARAHKPPAGLPPGLPPAAADGYDDLSSDPDDEPPPAAATGFKLNFNTLKRDAVDASKPVALKHTPREEVAAKAAAAAAGGDSDDLSSDPEDEVPAAKPTGFKLNFGGVKRDEVDASKPVALKHTPREDVVAKLGAGDDDDLSSDPEDETPAPKPTGFSLKLGAVKRDEVDASKPVAQSHTPREEVAAKAKLNLAAAAGSARGPASVVQQRTAAVAAKAQTAAPLRQLSTVPVDTTGDGKVDSLAIDTNHDGLIDRREFEVPACCMPTRLLPVLIRPTHCTGGPWWCTLVWQVHCPIPSSRGPVRCDNRHGPSPPKWIWHQRRRAARAGCP